MKRSLEKMVRARVMTVDGKIAEISITGDFFIYPEIGIEIIESALSGIDISSMQIASRIEKVIFENNIELAGISSSSIAHAVIKALKNGAGV